MFQPLAWAKYVHILSHSITTVHSARIMRRSWIPEFASLLCITASADWWHATDSRQYFQAWLADFTIDRCSQITYITAVFITDGKIRALDRQGGIGEASAVNAGFVWDHCGGSRAEPEGKAVNSQSLKYGLELWAVSCWKNEFTYKSVWN